MELNENMFAIYFEWRRMIFVFGVQILDCTQTIYSCEYLSAYRFRYTGYTVIFDTVSITDIFSSA